MRELRLQEYERVIRGEDDFYFDGSQAPSLHCGREYPITVTWNDPIDYSSHWRHTHLVLDPFALELDLVKDAQKVIDRIVAKANRVLNGSPILFPTTNLVVALGGRVGRNVESKYTNF